MPRRAAAAAAASDNYYPLGGPAPAALGAGGAAGLAGDRALTVFQLMRVGGRVAEHDDEENEEKEDEEVDEEGGVVPDLECYELLIGTLEGCALRPQGPHAARALQVG